MKILAVDDEPLALAALRDAICEAAPDAEVFALSSPARVQEFAGENVCDAAFLDIRLRGMTGLELARRLKGAWPHVNIIFVTGYDEYAVQAIGLRCSGYLLKPVRAEDVRRELEALREPPAPKRPHIYAQTFGHFDLYVDGEPLQFETARSKELLAYLIDRRGATMTHADISAVLWEGNDNLLSAQAQMRKTKKRLIETLERAGICDILRVGYADLGVNREKLICDYWQLLLGDAQALNSFTGEYMSGYSWGEMTLAWLIFREKKRIGEPPAPPVRPAETEKGEKTETPDAERRGQTPESPQ